MRFSPYADLSIGFKLGLLLAAFGIMATSLTGYYFYTSSRDMLVGASKRDLLTATQVVGRNMKIIIDEIAEDAQLLAAMPLTANVFNAPDQASADGSKKMLAEIFASMMKAHPEYFQIQLIGAPPQSPELERVDRSGKSLLRIIAAHPHGKARYPYVSNTANLAQGDIYLSDIAINHEKGTHSALNKPTIRISTPVFSPDGMRLGLIVISTDLDGLSRLLKVNLPPSYQLYLTNQWGDFLIHPDAAQTFGFDRGQRILVQDSFADVQPLVQGNSQDVVMRIDAASPGHDGQVAAFTRLPFGDTIDKRFVILGLAQPLDAITRETENVKRDATHIVLLFSSLALMLSFLVARIFTGPLTAVVEEINRFSKDRVMNSLPLDRKDEIGLLSRSFHSMQSQIVAHLRELNANRKELELLARYDTLTNLPNRRLFLERLEHAIANARRNGKLLAVLFIDLDGFKGINDTLGHAAGDEVLINVASQLKTAVRETDTVARLGGDEFVVLLDNLDSEQQAASIAMAIFDRFQHDMHVAGRELHVSASMGIGIYPKDGKNANDLMQNADMAMYHSKKDGKNALTMHAGGAKE
jgi:diguanylate cyclase (GGDEF)-like protein